jgi:hypothetical protein
MDSMTIKSKLFSGLLIPEWISFFLVLMIVPLVAYADCNWGGGSSTPQSVFDRSCRQQGGVPHGCSCDAPGASNSGNSNYDNGAAQRAQAEAAAAEAQRERDAELEQQRIETDKKRRMEEIANQAKFIEDRDAAASTLRGSTGIGNSDAPDGSGLRGSSETVSGIRGAELRRSGVSTGLRSANPIKTQNPNLDPMVVDARQVRSGLPKSVDNAITAGYSGAPPCVSDRVRKGFQAVATHDWKLARAWFKDALNHDPDNAGLKRLVELSDYTEKRIPQVGTGKMRRHRPQHSSLQLPQDSDMELLFPDLKRDQDKNSSSATGGSLLIRHYDPALELLFPGLPAIEAKEMNDYMLEQAIKATENDPVLIKLSNRTPIIAPNNSPELK